MPKLRGKIAAIAALILCVGLRAGAQTDVMTGNIQGVVRGQDGSPLPGVAVQAVNRDTGFRRTDSSDRAAMDSISSSISTSSTFTSSASAILARMKNSLRL